MRVKLILLVAAVLLVVTTAIFYRSGEQNAEDSVDRLKLIWSDPLSMPEKDRMLLAGLSRQCKLESVPAEVNAIIKCLRSAANSGDVKFNIDINVPDELESLLDSVSIKPKQEKPKASDAIK